MKHLFNAVFLLSFVTIFGQNQSNKPEEQAYIEVTGTAELEVIPDEIYIEIIIKERIENRTKVSIDEQEKNLKTAIKTLGIDMSNFYLSDANADYMKIRWQKKDVWTKKEYILKVSDAKTVGLVFQELNNLEITDASIFKVSHSKNDSLRKEVRIMAIKAAKNKADYLLNTLGENTGKPLIIREITQTAYISQAPAQSTRFVNTIVTGGLPASLGDDNEVIQFQKIKYYSSIYVKFSLE